MRLGTVNRGNENQWQDRRGSSSIGSLGSGADRCGTVTMSLEDFETLVAP
jgi:hypothetical protein